MTARKNLDRAAARYRKANAAREAALEELKEAIRAADAAGVPRPEIIEASGVTRRTVYLALKAET